MQKIIWLGLLTVIVGFLLFILNNGVTDILGVFKSGTPVLCLLVTFVVGLCFCRAPWGGVTIFLNLFVYVFLMLVEHHVLQHLPWWKIGINLVVQTLFFFYGAFFFELGHRFHKDSREVVGFLEQEIKDSDFFKGL